MLGTLVAIRCRGLAADEAHRQMDSAFAAVETVHGLMSFHEAGSDVTRLNTAAPGEVVQVAPQTFAVLAKALELAAASDGLFDITIAGQLVAWGRLPRPPGQDLPDDAATWRDIELIAPDKVRLKRRLWVDLGGIAKGYAVDRAVEHLSTEAGVTWCVNAGGDLRTVGPEPEPVLLDTETVDDNIPVLELENASLASSCGREAASGEASLPGGAHIHPLSRAVTGRSRFVSVVAQECVVADALTKVVLADPAKADGVLKSYGATAFLHGAEGGWTTLGSIPA